nr:unnamed protein product [Callosobruchus analis]
MQTIVF